MPTQPKTTYATSVVGGGTSVNSIPDAIWLEVDMRSESKAELAKIDGLPRRRRARVDQENAPAQVRAGKISADLKLIGDRPAGRPPAAADIVQTRRRGHRGRAPRPACSLDRFQPRHQPGHPGRDDRLRRRGRPRASLDEWIDVAKAEQPEGHDRRARHPARDGRCPMNRRPARIAALLLAVGGARSCLPSLPPPRRC